MLSGMMIHIARHQHHIGLAIALAQQIIEADGVFTLAACLTVEADQLARLPAANLPRPPTEIIASSSVILAR